MNRCIILGNKFEMRQAKICELMDEMGCSKVELKGEVEEFSKVMLMYSDILYGIEGEEIQLIKNPGIYSILDKDKLVAISSKISIHGQVYEISIFEKSYGEGNDIKTIEVELNAEHEIDGFDENFYDIKIKIKECIKDYYKEVYFIEDTQNEKICIELYKLIYNNENKFRSLINKYMVITYGANWFQKVIDKSYKDSVLNLNRWYREQEGAEFKNINGELYNLLINDLIEMLQKSQIDGVSISDRNKYNELFQSLESKSNLKKILENIDINKETVWDRNFKRYIDENFEEMWNEYKNMRNMVAHNKLVCRTVKNRIVEHSKKISIKLSEISKCIEKIYKDNERMYVKKVYEQISEEFYLEEAGGIKLPNKEDVFLEIEEDYCYSNMINKVDEKLNKLKDKREKVAWYIERVVEYYEDKNNMIEKSKLYNLFLILEIFSLEKDNLKRLCVSEINNQCILNRFIPEVIENLYKLIERLTDYRYFKMDSFNIGNIVGYKDIYGEKIKLISSGVISPYKGGIDTIELNMYIEDRLVESGFIEKQYFDYCIHEEEGYAMPEVEDCLEVKLDKLVNEILHKLDVEIQVLDNATQIFESNFVEFI